MIPSNKGSRPATAGSASISPLTKPLPPRCCRPLRRVRRLARALSPSRSTSQMADLDHVATSTLAHASALTYNSSSRTSNGAAKTSVALSCKVATGWTVMRRAAYYAVRLRQRGGDLLGC
jgi:hypothetical protein